MAISTEESTIASNYEIGWERWKRAIDCSETMETVPRENSEYSLPPTFALLVPSSLVTSFYSIPNWPGKRSELFPSIFVIHPSVKTSIPSMSYLIHVCLCSIFLLGPILWPTIALISSSFLFVAFIPLSSFFSGLSPFIRIHNVFPQHFPLASPHRFDHNCIKGLLVIVAFSIHYSLIIIHHHIILVPSSFLCLAGWLRSLIPSCSTCDRAYWEWRNERIKRRKRVTITKSHFLFSLSFSYIRAQFDLDWIHGSLISFSSTDHCSLPSTSSLFQRVRWFTP